MKVSPSILACDFSNIAEQIKKISDAGADMIHMDVMDGHFVPNISFGAPIISSLRNLTRVPFDVHLMISNPLDYIDAFSKAGADIITFHAESSSDAQETINKIHSINKKAGIAINPTTNILSIKKYLPIVDLVLIMTVEPGFGGQVFMENQIPKIESLKHIINLNGLYTLIEVDGGINPETAVLAKKSGVDICVAGTSIFKSSNIRDSILKIRQ